MERPVCRARLQLRVRRPDITITVPASFDAAAQRLTLAAARASRLPDHVRLLEEPQAAFYWWLEQQAGRRDPWRALPNPQTAARHVLVIDVGGGTSDFSLFELRQNEGSRDPGITQVAVSDHILLGGDNIDLAIAHLLEPRLAAGEGGLCAGQWDHLVARCRSLKCPASAPMRQNWRVEEGRISGSS